MIIHGQFSKIIGGVFGASGTVEIGDNVFIGMNAIITVNNSDYLQKARKYGHFTGYKN